MKKVFKYIGRKVSNFNRFSQSVTFEAKIKTRWIDFFGGLATFIVTGLIIVYGVILFARLMQKVDVQLNRNIIRTNLRTDPNAIDITEFDKIEFKIVVHKWNVPAYIPTHDIAEILTLQLFYYLQENNTAEQLPLKFKECSPELTKYDHHFSIVKHWCFSLQGKQISGVSTTNFDYKGVTAFMEVCFDHLNYICQSPALLNDVLSGLRVELFATSKYVDLNDIDSPIKEYVDRLDTTDLHPKVKMYPHINIEKHELILEDSWWLTVSEPDPIKFNKVCEKEKIEKFQTFYMDTDTVARSAYWVQIQVSPDIFQYRRKIFTFLELTGILGGIFEIFEVSFALLLGLFYNYFSKKSLLKEIHKSMKQLESTRRELDEIKAKILSKESSEKEQRSSMNHHSNLREEIQDQDDNEGGEDEKEQEPSFLKYLKQKEQRNLNDLLKQEKIEQKVQNFSYGDNKMPKNFIKVKERDSVILESFEDQRDCIDILFRIKTLETQVKYLLFKDKDYSTPKNEDNPDLNKSSSSLLKKEPEAINSDIQGIQLFNYKSLYQKGLLPHQPSMIDQRKNLYKINEESKDENGLSEQDAKML
ncbi:unnamed protein product [Moneuplotes crassus]|uniref:Uncharacterized protein n=1 Tax=Euplotes crassus TaxID=5936 RepID=A0AAD1UBL7_EUPCR|nr:unnamed protein product [Moneuplotes crassus]